MLTGIHTINTGAQFEQWARRTLCFPKLGDTRPFQTLLDTFIKDGKVLTGQPTGEMIIRFKDGSPFTHSQQNFLQVVQIAKDINLRFQRKAQTSFQTMCLEEDAEELDLLADMARKYRHRAADTAMLDTCSASEETEYALTMIAPAYGHKAPWAGLTKEQCEQLASMGESTEPTADVSMYGKDFDLAAMF